MTTIGDVLETTRANLAAADNGDPGPCYDGGVEAAEMLRVALEMTLDGRATTDEVETALTDVLTK